MEDSLIDKILICFCCNCASDGELLVSPVLLSDDANNEQPAMYGVSGEIVCQEVQNNYSTSTQTPIVQQPNNIVRVAPTLDYVRPRPKVQKNLKNTSVVHVPPVDVYSAFDSFPKVQIPTTTSPQLAPIIDSRCTSNVDNNDVQVLTTVASEIDRPTAHVHGNVVQVPTTVKSRRYRNRSKTNRFYDKQDSTTTAPRLNRLTTRLHNNEVPVTTTKDDPSCKALPHTYVPEAYSLQKKDEQLTSTNYKMMEDLRILEESCKHIDGPVVRNSLKANFKSQKEFEQCLAIHLGRGFDCSSSSSSSCMSELDEEYYLNRPMSIFAMRDQNRGDFDTDAQQTAESQGNIVKNGKKKSEQSLSKDVSY